MTRRGVPAHLDLNVSQPEVSIRFYGLVLDYLGFERLGHDDPERCLWMIEIGPSSWFGIEVRRAAEIPPRDHHERYAPGLDHLAFHAESRADVDGLHRLLRAAGIDVAEPPREYDYTPGYYAVAFDDPDGVRIELAHDPSTNP